MNIKNIVVAAVVASLPLVVQAKVATEIGAGVMLKNSAYGDYDDSAQAIPLITFDTTWFYADGGEFGFKPLDTGVHRIGTFLSVGEEMWDGSDNDNAAFDGFKDKDRAINLGISYRYKADWGVIRAQAFTDISSEYEGYGGNLGYAYPWKVTQSFTVIPSVKIKFMDSDYANYYYGISARDAATNAGVSAYDTGSATNIQLGIMTAYQVSQNWKLYAGVNYLALDSDIEDSPLLDDDNETSGILGAAYVF